MFIAKSFATPTRFHSLDALRGLAALAVVFWHWQHFYFQIGRAPIDFERSAQPMFSIFSTFYLYGWLAVDLFFSLSGFIFYWLYTEALSVGSTSAGRTTARQFFWLRFSRLYPLHIATLVLVALGQMLFKEISGNYFVYQINNFYHFLLNLTLLNAWGLQKDHSFNGPVWSISIEVFLYVMFFVMCHFRLVRWYWLLTAVLAGLLAFNNGYTYIGRGMISFFAGGLAYILFVRLNKGGYLSYIANLAIPILALMWFCIFAGVKLPGQSPLVKLDNEQLGLFCGLVVFPTTLLSLAVIEAVYGNFVGLLAKLGDISYASYLLHFPLQLIFATIVIAAGISPTIYNEEITLGLFFAVLIAISFISYRRFEGPLQSIIRDTFRTNSTLKANTLKA